MEGILKNWRGFVNEGITSQGKIVFNYYAFDWDDNLMKMPTKILFKETDKETDTDKIVQVDTHKFAQIRSKLPELGLEYLPNEGSFINFRDNDKANEQFKSDALSAPIVSGPWTKFVKAINMGSYFAIITARGHSPQTLKEAVKGLIDANREGIKKERLIRSLKRYRKLLGQPDVPPEMLVEDYLNNCQFSPVSNPQISGAYKTQDESGNEVNAAASPEELKVKEFDRFEKSMISKSQDMNVILGQGNQFIESGEFRIGFSDDDIKNIKHFAKAKPDVATFATDPTTGRTRRFRDGQR
jgi:hypothetical protein